MSGNDFSREVANLIKGRRVNDKKTKSELLFGSSSESEDDSVPQKVDQQKLSSMTEVEREAYIFELEQAKQAKRERRELEKRILKMEKAIAEPEGGDSKATAFENKLRKMERLRDSRRRRRDAEDSEYSVSEEEDYDMKVGKPAAKFSRPSFNDILRVIVLRDQIENFLYRPGFADIIQGSFARVNVGRGKDGSSVYRLCRVLKIVEGNRSYSVGRSATNLRAVLSIGDSQREATLDIVSNGRLSADEYDYWLKLLESSKDKTITEKNVQRKAAQMEEYFSKPIDNSEMTSIIERKKLSGQIKVNVAAEKTRLLHELEVSKTNNDPEKFRLIKQKLEDLASNESKESQPITFQHGPKKLFTGIPNSESAQAELDPFRRRKCKPVDVTLSDGQTNEGQMRTAALTEQTVSKKPESSQSSLVAAHDFDLEIDL